MQFGQGGGAVLLKVLGFHILRQQQLKPVQNLGGGRFFLQALLIANLVELSERCGQQFLLYAGVVHFDDLLERVHLGKPDIVKEASTQERVGQFFFVVRSNDHDRTMARLDRLAGLVDKELHLIEFLEQIVRELDVSLVNLVDQQHDLFVGVKRLPQLAFADVISDVMYALFA